MNAHRLKLVFILLTALVLSGCNLPLEQSSPPDAFTQSWIDAPLNGSTLPLAPVEVVSHSSDLGGIAQIELSVSDGVTTSIVKTDPSPDLSKTLVTMKQPWVPLAPGMYTLKVRAQNKSGAWGDYATSVITIEGGIFTETPTPIPLLPTATMLPPTATMTSTSTLSTASIEIVRITADRIAYEGGAGCAPSETTIMVRAAHPDGIQVVVLFFRLRNKDSGETTEWLSKAMNPQGGDSYSAIIRWADFSSMGFPGSGEAWLQYQAIVQTVGGDTSTRTPVTSNITAAAC